MKNKSIACLISALVFLGMVLTAQAWAQEPESFDPPEDGLEINYLHGKNDQSVEFNHSSHESFECADCHHRMNKGKETQAPQSCAACHNNFNLDNMKGYKSYFKAMHKIRFAPAKDRPSCLACHTSEMGAQDKEMTGCSSSACHPNGIHR